MRKLLSKLNPFGKKEKDKKPRTRMAEVTDYHMEKAVRIWGISQLTKTMMVFGLFVFAIIMGWVRQAGELNRGDYVSQIPLYGTMSDAEGGAGYTLVKRIQEAVKDERSRAVLILANSGGGSPTQAEIAYQYLAEYTSQPITERKPIYVSIQSNCASACYYAVAPADRIFAHQNSIVGSIGVRMDTWDFTGLADKLGIKKNLLATGDHKIMMDSFREMTESDKEVIMESLMMPMHEQFVSAVKAARPDKLNFENDNLFNGFIWLGDQAYKNGLIDEVATVIQVEDWAIENLDATHVRKTHNEGFSLKQFITGSFSSFMSWIGF